ncbi:MAG: hypothetical protein H8E72_00035 [Candidatus Marinimicrobia bacterium]|nr:hypothetical protein [Candidatus Neomarinimicrobiota bacterium]
MKFKQLLKLVIITFSLNIVFTQECGDGYTYFTSENIPGNVNVLDGSNCFKNTNIDVLNDLITLNALDYSSPLEVGVQTWLADQLYIWVATYTPNGVNGVNEQLTQLPEDIGQLANLKQLYLEWNTLTNLPSSFSQLSNLENLAVSNNWLTALPSDFGNLTELSFVDLGYNQITEIPESIGYLQNIEYLWLFNNQFSSVPESICDLPLIWSGTDFNNYPYFAIGGNQICDLENTPDCVATSGNLNISLDQFYYSFLIDAPQECEEECPNLGDLNGDGGWNVLDIVTLANCVLAGDCSDLDYGCAGDLNGDGGYNVLDIVTLANCVLAGDCGN